MFKKFFVVVLVALVFWGCVEKKQSIDELNEELKGLGVKLEKVDPKEIKENKNMRRIYDKEGKKK